MSSIILPNGDLASMQYPSCHFRSNSNSTCNTNTLTTTLTSADVNKDGFTSYKELQEFRNKGIWKQVESFDDFRRMQKVNAFIEKNFTGLAKETDFNTNKNKQKSGMKIKRNQINKLSKLDGNAKNVSLKDINLSGKARNTNTNGNTNGTLEILLKFLLQIMQLFSQPNTLGQQSYATNNMFGQQSYATNNMFGQQSYAINNNFNNWAF